MKLGTKSLLFGAHQFLLHPLYLFIAWRRLYGFPWDPRLWAAFILHDIGYWGRGDLDGFDGKQHPEAGARLMGKLFGRRWRSFTLYHSREYAKLHSKQVSKLCVADKLAFCVAPYWAYLPLVWLTDEISELTRDHPHGDGSLRSWYAECRHLIMKWIAKHHDTAFDYLAYDPYRQTPKESYDNSTG